MFLFQKKDFYCCYWLKTRLDFDSPTASTVTSQQIQQIDHVFLSVKRSTNQFWRRSDVGSLLQVCVSPHDLHFETGTNWANWPMVTKTGRSTSIVLLLKELSMSVVMLLLASFHTAHGQTHTHTHTAEHWRSAVIVNDSQYKRVLNGQREKKKH